MYKFVKIADKKNKKSGTWYFVPNSIEQVREHFEKIFGQEIKAGVHDAVERRMYHPTTAWRTAVDIMNDLYVEPWYLSAVRLENQVLNDRIRFFEEGKPMYLANGVVHFWPTWDLYEIVDEVELEELEYPREAQFHLEEVRYMQWDMPGITKGKHWYAKIGNRDVKDKDGNMKWDTKAEAEKAAEWFCNYLNYKTYFCGGDSL